LQNEGICRRYKQLDAEIELIEKNNIKVLFWDDAEYPESLKTLTVRAIDV